MALSAHVEVQGMETSGREIAALSAMLRERFGIEHVTLQPETRELHDAIACCEFPDGQFDKEHRHAGGSDAALRTSPGA